MARSDLGKVEPGHPLRIPARAYNAFVDAAKANRALNSAGGGQHWHHSQLVAVRNISGEDQDQFAVMGIDGPIFTPTDNLQEFLDYVGLDVTTPEYPLHWGLFVILAEPIPDGEIGAATISGVTVVKLDVGVGESGWGFADVLHDRTDVLKMLQRNAEAMIVWKESGEGEKWAIVRLSNLYTDTL